jgi:hypothetical protein
MSERKRLTPSQATKVAYRIYEGANTLAAAKEKIDTDHRLRWLLVIAILGFGAVVVLVAAALEIGFWIALFSH